MASLLHTAFPPPNLSVHHRICLHVIGEEFFGPSSSARVRAEQFVHRKRQTAVKQGASNFRWSAARGGPFNAAVAKMTTDGGDRRPWDRTGFVAETPHFIRIMFSDMLQRGKLHIPEKLVRRYASDLSVSKSALLHVPSGLIWTVELEKRDGRVWFCKGWQEFVDHHTLGYGHLLYFRYEGGSTFHVVIFDTTTYEIDYPLREPGGFLSPQREEEAEDDDDDDDDLVIELETLDGFEPIRPKSEVGGPSEIPRSPSKTELGGKVKQTKRRASAPVQVHCNHTSPMPCPLEAAGQFKSEHPFFELMVRPSYLHKSRANVPSEFLKRHVPDGLKTVTLKQGDRSWRVTLNRYHRGKVGTFSRGWSAFTRETHLMKGDVCLFELIEPKDYVLRVSIFRKHIVNLD